MDSVTFAQQAIGILVGMTVVMAVAFAIYASLGIRIGIHAVAICGALGACGGMIATTIRAVVRIPRIPVSDQPARDEDETDGQNQTPAQ